jgi:hypothetical protein
MHCPSETLTKDQDCGSQQRVQVPREFIRRLEKLRQGPTLQVAATGSSSSQSTTSGSSGSPIANLSSSQTSLSSGAQSSKSLKIPDPSPAGQQVSTVKTPSLRRTNNAFGTLFVFLVARVGDYYKLCQLEVQGKNDDEFFSDLKRQYFKARALLRTWLSIWKYAHCDFYLVRNALPDMPSGDDLLVLSVQENRTQRDRSYSGEDARTR